MLKLKKISLFMINYGHNFNIDLLTKVLKYHNIKTNKYLKTVIKRSKE